MLPLMSSVRTPCPCYTTLDSCSTRSCFLLFASKKSGIISCLRRRASVRVCKCEFLVWTMLGCLLLAPVEQIIITKLIIDDASFCCLNILWSLAQTLLQTCVVPGTTSNALGFSSLVCLARREDQKDDYYSPEAQKPMGWMQTKLLSMDSSCLFTSTRTSDTEDQYHSILR